MKLNRSIKHKQLNHFIRVVCLTGALVAYSGAMYAAVIDNTTLPGGGHWIAGKGEIARPGGNVMNVVQNGQNAVIKWDDFSIGANAEVNFFKDGGGKFNILNYVDSGNTSQIYGAMNAEGGNVFLVNTAGTVIGKSAQINVGSLYVSNKKLNEKALKGFNGTLNGLAANEQPKDAAAIMSLGNINATSVTFDGSRIVLDTDRLVTGGEKMAAEKILLKTNDKNNIVAGYDAYDKTNKYAGKNTDKDVLATVQVNNGANEKLTKKDGYMWVKNLEQLQAMNSNLGGNYALHNSIDAIATEKWNNGKGFVSIGSESDAFTGKFDGLDNDIFGLTIDNKNSSSVGLFGYANGAVINNVTLVAGSITGDKNVGSVVGTAVNTTINNVKNSAHVTGNTNVGGVAGSAQNTAISNAINTAPIRGHENAGGIAGSMGGGSLTGTTYNLGAVTGINNVNDDKEDEKYIEDNDISNDNDQKLNDNELAKKYSHNIGGLIGSASGTAIGNDKDGFQMYNQLDITGGYNVGGIVGNMTGGNIQNVANHGNITAMGYTNGTYYFHSNHKDYGVDKNKNKVIEVTVNTANAGGIVGTVTSNDDKAAEIKNVVNTGDVKSQSVAYKDSSGRDDEYYLAGNIGGIVGNANNTNITNAENKENQIHGAHNIGGIAGSYTGKGTISNSLNNGGDIMGTGARGYTDVFDKDNKPTGKKGIGFVREKIIYGEDDNTSTTAMIIGNIGGIAGSMYGNDVKITNSGNRGTVHGRLVAEGTEADNVLESSKTANVGGIVGKIDRDRLDNNTLLEEIKKGNYENVSVSNSYNTGLVQGYTGVGGIAGTMYNGSIVGSYNIGNIMATRQVTNKDKTGGLNLGGIVGDTLEKTNARVLLYGVYNNGTIGDKSFNLYGRHVGGVVGRLSGDVYNSYNTGDVYNGYMAVGGIVGWWSQGTMKNVFNTGNITVLDNDSENNDFASVGGIAGGTSGGGTFTDGNVICDGRSSLINAYNLGTIRVFDNRFEGEWAEDRSKSVGGIIGNINYNSKLTIKNVYSTSEIFTGKRTADDSFEKTKHDTVGGIYGEMRAGGTIESIENAFIIGSDATLFQDFTESKDYKTYKDKGITYLQPGTAGDIKNWDGKFTFDNDFSDGAEADSWRFYNGLPIMNAFLPKLAELEQAGGLKDANGNAVNVQYGNAYNPFLNIIHSQDDITISGDSLNRVDGVAVFEGGSLTISGLGDASGMMYGGTLYTEGTLAVSGAVGKDLKLGKASELYGSSVSITSDGNFAANGTIVATGETAGKTGVDIKAKGDVEILGSVKTLKAGDKLSIDGLKDQYEIKDFAVTDEEKKKLEKGEKIVPESLLPDKKIPTVGNAYSEEIESKNNGNITIASKEGNVNVLYGNLGEGFINSSGDLTVSGTEVYMDSDLLIGGNLNITADTSVLDISNIGKVQTPDDNVKGLHAFLDHFMNGSSINFKAKTGDTKADAMITVDMWNEETGAFDLRQLDFQEKGEKEPHSLYEDLGNLNITVDGNDVSGQDLTHIWISNAEQLQGIQAYYKNHGTEILDVNFALRYDLDASHLENFEAIGSGSEKGFTGKFDGRGNAIIGLTVKHDDPYHSDTGIFSRVGVGGVVDDLRVHSSVITGSKHVGLIAGENYGAISNITGFGNSVNVADDSVGDEGAVGGIAGINNKDAVITNVEIYGTVTSGDEAETHLGGIVGINDGKIQNSASHSAISVTNGTAGSMGGIAGTNNGTLNNVDNHGVLSGLYKAGDDQYRFSHYAENVGGIAGINSGVINSAYNDSIVTGYKNVGGIVGWNTEKGTMNNLANATETIGGENIGGIAGTNEGKITNGRNNGEILAQKGLTIVDAQGNVIKEKDGGEMISSGSNIGGLVGHAGENAFMSNLVNDMSAAITGYGNVGGIIGWNEGVLTSSNNLMNKGAISGVHNVGGVIGINSGIVANINNQNSFEIKINEAYTGSSLLENAYENFGGVVGNNEQNGIIFDVANSGNITAKDANQVGGIIGVNNGYAFGILANSGNIIGKDTVGGIMGVNNSNIDYTAVDEKVIERLEIKLGVEITDKEVLKAHMMNGVKAESHIDDDHNLQPVYKLHANTVKGSNQVGGIIGSNKGNIAHSDVINSTTAAVAGTNNVGGLIGINDGSVLGGRDDGDKYYAHHVYNNGSVQGSENVGGLIGANNGSLDAAYNTGAVSGGANVGGIAGVNSGSISQVFNTIMLEDNTQELHSSPMYKPGAVTGSSNVGGLVGSNSGKVESSYNTSEVSVSAGGAGNVVGVNEAGGIVSGVYAANTSGSLIGDNQGIAEKSYSLSEADKDKEGVTVLTQEQSKESGSYGDFKENNDTWKFYDGFTNPLLKVFLTKADYNDFNGTVEGNKLHGADGNGAFNYNNWLVQAGEYKELIYLFSQQIAGGYWPDGTFNPNNLGYDLEGVFDPNPVQPGFWEAADKYAWSQKRAERERKAEVHFVDGGMEI